MHASRIPEKLSPSSLVVLLFAIMLLFIISKETLGQDDLAQYDRKEGIVSLKSSNGGLEIRNMLNLGNLGKLVVGKQFRPSTSNFGCEQAVISLVSRDMSSVLWSNFILPSNYSVSGLISSNIIKVIDGEDFYQVENEILKVENSDYRYVIIGGNAIVSNSTQTVTSRMGCNIGVSTSARPFIAKARIGRDGLHVVWFTLIDNPHSHGPKEFLTDFDYKRNMDNNVIVASSLIVDQNNDPVSFVNVLDFSTGTVTKRLQVSDENDLFIMTKVKIESLEANNMSKNTHIVFGGGKLSRPGNAYRPSFGVIDLTLAINGTPSLNTIDLQHFAHFSGSVSDANVTGILFKKKKSINTYTFSISILQWGQLGMQNSNQRGPAYSYVTDCDVINNGGAINFATDGAIIHQTDNFPISPSFNYDNEVVSKQLYKVSENEFLHYGGKRESGVTTGGLENIPLAKESYLMHFGSGIINPKAYQRYGYDSYDWDPTTLTHDEIDESKKLLYLGGRLLWSISSYYLFGIKCVNLEFDYPQDCPNNEFLEPNIFILPVLEIFATYDLPTKSLETNRNVNYDIKASGILIDRDCACIVPETNPFSSRKQELARNLIQNSNATKAILFPNPARDELNVKVNNGTNIVAVEILNSFGQSVMIFDASKNDERSELKINTSVFPSGIYLIKVKTFEGLIMEKLIIRH